MVSNHPSSAQIVDTFVSMHGWLWWNQIKIGGGDNILLVGMGKRFQDEMWVVEKKEEGFGGWFVVLTIFSSWVGRQSSQAQNTLRRMSQAFYG